MKRNTQFVVAILMALTFLSHQNTVSAGNCVRKTRCCKAPTCDEKIAALQKYVCCLKVAICKLSVKVTKNEKDLIEERRLRKEQAIAFIHLREAFAELKDSTEARDKEVDRRLEAFRVLLWHNNAKVAELAKLSSRVTALEARKSTDIAPLTSRVTANENAIRIINTPKPVAIPKPRPRAPTVAEALKMLAEAQK